MIVKDSSLSADIVKVIRHQATDAPHTGCYNITQASGSYLCRACGLALFRSHTKFKTSCGWPSFDEALPQAVKERLDTDGIRSEIICARCEAHLGHVFEGEGLTDKNRRYCVNSSSLDFVGNTEILDTEEAIVAGGCFWGVQYSLDRLSGVLKTEVGYTGGEKVFPTYQELCTGTTGHFEAVRVVYDPVQLSYEALLKYFFEIHDASQADGQGPDRGRQYQSAIFYYDTTQKETAEAVIGLLQKPGYRVVTHLLPISVFWVAESSHQHYYDSTKHTPYCHIYTKR